MIGTYRLHQDTYGFIESTKRVVTIPAGAIVALADGKLIQIGICAVVWEDQVIQASREDVRRNGTMISQTGVG